jgi:hypothetical protein
MTPRTIAIAVIATCALVAHPALSRAQRGGGAAPPQTAKAAAPIDLTGYWVAFVTEDWCYRMVTPLKGDYRGVALNADGTRLANTWTPATQEPDACKAFGAAAIMRIPGRLHITWQDDNTLRVDTDAGTQTRLFRFGAGGASRAGEASGATRDRTWQGDSSARWERAGARGGPAASGSLTVVTTNVRAGYLRRNGVPYSEDATVSEYFDLSPLPGNGQLLIVTTVVEDPKYLQRPYIVSSHFKKEADASKWDPTSCSAF